MKKSQSWTLEEDKMLFQLYEKVDCFQRWKFISKKFQEIGISKTQFQCRQRFNNHVDPSIKPGKLSQSEIVKLFKCYDEYGPHWSSFQSKLPGRPQSLLKNKFYSTLRSLVRNFVKVGQKRNLYSGSFQFHKISTKLLIELYDGKRKFYACRNILKNTLKNTNYSIDSQILQNYLNIIKNQQIQPILKTIRQNIGASKENVNKDRKIKKNFNREKKQMIQINNQYINTEENNQNQHREQDNPDIFIDHPVYEKQENQEIFQAFLIFPIQGTWTLMRSAEPSIMNYYNQ